MSNREKTDLKEIGSQMYKINLDINDFMQNVNMIDVNFALSLLTLKNIMYDLFLKIFSKSNEIIISGGDYNSKKEKK